MAGKVCEICLENFKSYESIVKIRFDRNFTCVVGPNGAGKSNLVDAVSFVLCVPGGGSSRGGSLLNLIHRKEGDAAISRTASVSVLYEAEGRRSLFRRTVNQRSEEHLWLDGAEVARGEYMRKLEQCNILSRARNFLVYQGDIESVAHRQGKDLTAFFEQVSGSVAHRPEYERLLAEKSSKEETMRCRNLVKRNAMNEKKRVAHEKTEAESFRRLDAQWQRMRVQFYLFRLACVKHLSDIAATAHRDEAEKQKRLQLQVENKREELVDAEAEQLQSNLTLAETEQAAVAARDIAEQIQPKRVEVWSKMAYAGQQRAELQQEVDRQKARRIQLEGEADRLGRALDAAKANLGRVDQKLRHAALFTAAQQQEFDAAQDEAERESSEKSQQARELDAQIRVKASERAQVEVEVREARLRFDQLQARAEDLRIGLARTETQHDSDVQELTLCSSNIDELKTWIAGQEGELSNNVKERQKIQKEIQDLAMTERQIERESKLRQISTDLQRVIPGVHGRVVERCNTSRRDLNKAIHVALGSYLDAVIVDSTDVGRLCVQYLKERMLEPLTFLPMGALNVELDGQLRDAVGQHEGVYMAKSCITYDQEKHGKAFDFLLGNVVIADSLDVGKRFWKDMQRVGLRCRIVTMQGETISTNGNYAHNSDASSQGATRFEFTLLDKKKKRLDELATKICSDKQLCQTGHEEMTATHDNKVALEAKEMQSKKVLERHGTDLQVCTNNLQEAADALETRQPVLEKVQNAETELRQERETLDEAIGLVVSKHFAALSLAMGVPDIRQREREWRQERTDAQRQEDDLLHHKGSVQAELMLVKQALDAQAQRNLAQKLSDLDAQMEKLERSRESIERQGGEMEAEARGCVDTIDANKREKLKREQTVLKHRREMKQTQVIFADSAKKVVEREADLLSLQEKRQDLLCQSVYDGVELPFATEQAEGLGRDALHELAGSSHADGAAARAAAIAVDLNTLDREKRRVVERGAAAQQTEEERYRGELRKLVLELERRRPNLKAIEQLRQANQDVEQSAQDAVDAQRHLDEARECFEAVRKQRFDLFMACFQQVAMEIDNIYKKLTVHTAGVSASTEGGSAFLDLEDLEDPFCAGVNFTAMPPAKRVSDLGQLSGGEKAMAALALLFAVHTYQKPPFLMLDEVDAHLDANNMYALSTFLRSFGRQTIVISLKEQLFTQCEAMVGVSKNMHKERSCIFTFDLENLRNGGVPGGSNGGGGGGGGSGRPGDGDGGGGGPNGGAPVTPLAMSPAHAVLLPQLDSPAAPAPSPPPAAASPPRSAASASRASPPSAVSATPIGAALLRGAVSAKASPSPAATSSTPAAAPAAAADPPEAPASPAIEAEEESVDAAATNYGLVDVRAARSQGEESLMSTQLDPSGSSVVETPPNTTEALVCPDDARGPAVGEDIVMSKYEDFRGGEEAATPPHREHAEVAPAEPSDAAETGAAAAGPSGPDAGLTEDVVMAALEERETSPRHTELAAIDARDVNLHVRVEGEVEYDGEGDADMGGDDRGNAGMDVDS